MCLFLLYASTSLIRVFVSPNFLPDRLASFYSSQGCLHVSHHLARPSLSHHLHEMPDLSNKPVEMRFKLFDFACFGTQRYKYQYGMLLHDIPKARENSMGSFILPPEDDFEATVDAQEFGETVELTREAICKSFRVETYHIKTILAATRKLTLGPSDSDYKINFTLMRKLHLTQLRKNIPADVLK